MSIRCTRCRSDKFKKNGKVRGLIQQYRCKLCGARFSLTDRRKNYDEKKYMAVSMHLMGVNYRHISRQLKVSDVAVRKWVLKFKDENPVLHGKLESKEKYFPFVRTVDLTEHPGYLSTQRINNSKERNGGIFFESYSKLFRNKIIKVELIPKE